VKLQSHPLSKLTNYLSEQLGLSFAGDRLADLEKNIEDLADSFNFDEVDQFIEWMVNHPIDQEDIEILAEYLTVGETYFFRDAKAFLVLEQEVLPAIVALKKENSRFLRIWSAGCCTGEEPYSIAMVLHRLIPNIEDWQIKLVATDINASFLEKASAGVYSEWSFRATEQELRDKYFTQLKKGGYRICDEIRHMVQFKWLNLADLDALKDSSLSCMDIIFCRNVFIYFEQSTILNVMAQLHECLVDRGSLFVGPNELPATRPPGFAAVHRPGVIILQKAPDSETESLPGEPIEPDSDSDSDTIFDTITADAAQAIPTFEEARRAYEQFEYKKSAELLLKRCLAGKDADALVLLSKCYANLGETKSALHWCQLAIKANPLNPFIYYLQSTILQENGDTQQAIACLRQAISLSSEFVLAEFTLGNLLKQSGQEKEAAACFTATLKLLNLYKDDDIIAESDGTTASGLKVIVSSLLSETVRPSKNI